MKTKTFLGTALREGAFLCLQQVFLLFKKVNLLLDKPGIFVYTLIENTLMSAYGLFL